ncbi:hypothetical protein F0562_009145 [Nyssa sinensis]|uniref:Neprosin PEP catalytic domain-containing protein n=1 Tax=Nyssa sinensis TaxID=561372 RepID=A0A5J4ZV38_9ASTE|nr:hypothetical protein F0562_009145 [Nyssa sinensis]
MSSSSDSSTTITIPHTQSPAVLTMSTFVTVRLNPDNYILWKAQMVPYFLGQDLFGYLDGTIPKPPQFISGTHPETHVISASPNPAYSHWLRQDNLILSALISSLTEGVLAQVVNHTTSSAVWHALDKNFSSCSRARTVQIRTQLAIATKGGKSATDYFLFIKKLTDELAVAGQPLTCDDVITYILAGLGHEYDSFVASISARTDKVTIEEIYSLLLTTEARLSRHQLSSPTPPTSVNIAQRQYHPSQNRGRGGSRGRGRSTHAGSTARHTDHNPVVCQVCNKPGHSARKCYLRFDLSYQDPKPEPKHTLVAASTGPWDTDWHVDTGATHHVTNDLNNLSLRNEDYQGSDQSHHPQALSTFRVSNHHWHRHLGHAAAPVVNKILSLLNIPAASTKQNSVCSDCQMAKSHALPFQLSSNVSSHPLDLIFTDVWGPAFVASSTGSDAAIRAQAAPAPSQVDNLLPDLQHHRNPPANVPASSNHHPMTTRSKNNIHKPRKNSDDSVRHPLPRALLAEHSPAKEPTCFTEASKFIECKHARIEKHLDLEHKGTVKTIKSEDGDVIDCVDIYKQPAFDHPLVKSIQMKPDSYPSGMKPKSSQAELLVQLWHKNGQCPQRTVPIKRTPKQEFSRKTCPSDSQRTEQPIIGPDNLQHEYAIVEIPTDNNRYYGAHASINVWDPRTEIDSEFSLSQIWIVNRDQGLNTIEAGWMVYPGMYGDKQPRLFIYWTSDGYRTTGCYDLRCPGFVQTNRMFALGSPITQVSSYKGQSFEMDITIFKDKSSGNWWLQVQNVILGYWPSSIFTGLANTASLIQWGGEITNRRSFGRHTATQMGSGHFPNEGYGKSSFFHNLKYVDNSNTLRDPQQLRPHVSYPTCYNLYLKQNNPSDSGTYFYYGGPGYSAQCP